MQKGGACTITQSADAEDECVRYRNPNTGETRESDPSDDPVEEPVPAENREFSLEKGCVGWGAPKKKNLAA